MTKKKKRVSPASKFHSVSFKFEETAPSVLPKSVPLNLAEQKARFLKTGLTPKFEVHDHEKLAELAGKTKNQIRFDLQSEAEHILEYVRDKYGDGEFFLEHAFGPRITKEQATPMVLEYINDNNLSESLKIHWCDSIACSAKMVWRGPTLNANKPELRKYSLWINWSDENNYMRESGIKCLMDHEIGTHFFRLINDGFQPWFSDRTRFDLRSMGSFEGMCTEEGLASIHTSLRGRVRLLWGPAMAYYTACKAAEMSFKQLFDHLGRYTSNIDFRWKQVMRVKRGLQDPSDLGGFGNDQCYFEGAVKILRNMENIDFHLLMSGKICMDEVQRIKRVVRRDVLQFPVFMKDMTAYRKTLKKMLILNGLNQEYHPRAPPAVFTKRLQERSMEAGGAKTGKSKKVRSKLSKSWHSCKNKGCGVSVVKNSTLGCKEKKASKKKSDKSGSPEVEKFPVSNNYIHNLHLKQASQAAREQEKKTTEMEQNLRQSIASLDCSIGEQIDHLRNLVAEHTWSSCDSGYRESLISEVSNGGLTLEDSEESERPQDSAVRGQKMFNRANQSDSQLSFTLDISSENSCDLYLESSDHHKDQPEKEEDQGGLSPSTPHTNDYQEICCENPPQGNEEQNDKDTKIQENKFEGTSDVDSQRESSSFSQNQIGRKHIRSFMRKCREDLPQIDTPSTLNLGPPRPSSCTSAGIDLPHPSNGSLTARSLLASRKSSTHSLSAWSVREDSQPNTGTIYVDIDPEAHEVVNRRLHPKSSDLKTCSQSQVGKHFFRPWNAQDLDKKRLGDGDKASQRLSQGILTAIGTWPGEISQQVPIPDQNLSRNIFLRFSSHAKARKKLLNRRDSGKTLKLLNSSPFDGQCITKSIEKVDAATVAIKDSLSSGEFVQYRVPKLKGASTVLNRIPLKSNKVLLTNNVTLTASQAGERSLAGVKLGSLSGEKVQQSLI